MKYNSNMKSILLHETLYKNTEISKNLSKEQLDQLIVGMLSSNSIGFILQKMMAFLFPSNKSNLAIPFDIL